MNKSDILSKLNEMQIEMDKLKGLLEKEEESKTPFGKVVDKSSYYYVGSTLNVFCDKDNSHGIDIDRLEVGNYFNNDEYAQKVANQFRVHLMMLKFSEENGMSEIDWNNDNAQKHRIELDMSNLEFGIEHNFVYNHINCVYFNSHEVAQDFIDKHGNEVLELLGYNK